MIERTEARRAAENLRGMRMYPDLASDDGKAVMRSILDRLSEHADDAEHALRATAHLRDTADFFPTPAAMIDALEETHQAKGKTAHPRCGFCDGTGWETIWRGETSAVKRCRCGGYPPVPDPAKAFEGATFADVAKLAERDGVR